MKAELESHPDITSVVYSSRVPSMQNLDGQGYIPEGEQIVMENFQGLAVNQDRITTGTTTTTSNFSPAARSRRTRSAYAGDHR